MTTIRPENDRLAERLTPILIELEALLWERDNQNLGAPGYSDEALRAAVKIFSHVLWDKTFAKMMSDRKTISDATKDVEELGDELRNIIMNHTGIDLHELYDRE